MMDFGEIESFSFGSTSRSSRLESTRAICAIRGKSLFLIVEIIKLEDDARKRRAGDTRSQNRSVRSVALFLHRGYEHRYGRFLNLAELVTNRTRNTISRTHVRIRRTRAVFSLNHLPVRSRRSIVRRRRAGVAARNFKKL